MVGTPRRPVRRRQSPLTIEEVRAAYLPRRDAIRARLDDFSRIRPDDYFYELVYCLLTPQSSAVNAGRVVADLQGRGFRDAPIDPEESLARKESYIRFHRTKSLHLLAMKRDYPVIHEYLTAGHSPEEMRAWLVANVGGMGWKEASHFLRNIGNRDLAILDRHILKNLLRLNVVRKIPPTLTPKRYRLLEGKFHTFAQKIGIPMDELDLLFWSMETGEILK